MLLSDEEWAKKSDVWIAKHACVSHTFVAKLRQPETLQVGTRLGQDGKTRKLPERKSRTTEPRAPSDTKPEEIDGAPELPGPLYELR